MNRSLEQALSIYKDAIDGLIASPGKGAERAVAVIVALNANKEIPWDKVSKLTINWIHIDREIFPEIDMEFHK